MIIVDEQIPQAKAGDITIFGYQPFSRERTRERYFITFVWEIAEQRILGYDLTFSTDQKGRNCLVEKVDPDLTKDERKTREKSLNVKGAKLFNMLPRDLRNFNGDTDDFVSSLDSYLMDIPDNPKCPFRQCFGEENSLLILLPKFKNKSG